MSKNTNQEPEAPEEPEYQEPTYESTIGKKEKSLNDDSLMQLMNQVKSNSKKGKKNRKERQNESKNQEKKKKIIIDDPNELKQFNFANAPQKTSTQKEEKSDFQQVSQANYKNTAILATVSGQIEESDVSRFFNGLSIYKIHTEPGYFIIEFDTEEDLHKALQKNKTPYTNNIMVLVGEYSIEDENPKPEKHDFPKPYLSSRYPSYNDDDDDYYPPKKQFSLGERHQQPQREQSESSSRAYTSKKPIISLGGRHQSQQTDSPKPYSAPYRAQSSTGKYVAPYAKASDPRITLGGKQETLKPIETSNSFDILKDEDQ